MNFVAAKTSKTCMRYLNVALCVCVCARVCARAPPRLRAKCLQVLAYPDVMTAYEVYATRSGLVGPIVLVRLQLHVLCGKSACSVAYLTAQLEYHLCR